MDQYILGTEASPFSIDRSPLAWVLEDLKKSLKFATAVVRRFAWEVKSSIGNNALEMDTSPLSQVQRQLQQGAAALDMVGQQVPAVMLRAVESLSRKFIQSPKSCTEDAAHCIDRSCLAVVDYLEGILKGRTLSPVALFPQHRAVLVRIGAERIHPADLWSALWHWRDIALPRGLLGEQYSSEIRVRMSESLLTLLHSGDHGAAREMTEYCAALAAGRDVREQTTLWALAAGFFEAISLDLVPKDIYVKRAASNVLQQFGVLRQGTIRPSERVAQDLTFFCAMAQLSAHQSAPHLRAVREAYGLEHTPVSDYEIEKLGRLDADQLDRVLRKIAAASEAWSAFANGETHRAGSLADLFSEVGTAVLKVHSEHTAFVSALSDAVELAIHEIAPLRAALAMEVATAILYLEAAYTHLDADAATYQRSAQLAARLHHVCAANDSYPIEDWMEELYRRASDQQTMGSVTRELRISLVEVEKALDQFFRSGRANAVLHAAPAHLAQMRGVFMVLGLEQAALAAVRMRSSIEKYLLDSVDAAIHPSALFDTLGNSLGAMGFMIDMLSYQLPLARRMFVYDEGLAEFRSIIERDRSVRTPPITPTTLSLDRDPPPQYQSTFGSLSPFFENLEDVISPETEPTPVLGGGDEGKDLLVSGTGDEDIHQIFLDESKEVILVAASAVQELAAQTGNIGAQVRLRRAFHTIKGSARMVGLQTLGEAAWAFERLLNEWLADETPFTGAMFDLTSSAVRAFEMWVDDISHGRDGPWTADPFRDSADAFRTSGEYRPLRLPDYAVQGTDDGRCYQTLASGTTQLSEQSEQQPIFDVVNFSTDQVTRGLFEQAAVSIPVLTALPSTDGVPIGSPNKLGARTGNPPPEVSDTAEADLSPPVSPAPMKVIGHLRLSPAFFAVYSTEADEWSSRLIAEIEQWVHDPEARSTEAAMVLAHSLQGASATVGFDALAELARMLEQALEHVGSHPKKVGEWAIALLACARHIGDLLADFTNGNLPKLDEALMVELKRIVEPNGWASRSDPLEVALGALQDSIKNELSVTPTAPGPGLSGQWKSSVIAATGDRENDDLNISAIESSAVAHAYAPSQATQTLEGYVQTQSIPQHDLESEDAIDAELLPIFREEGHELFLALGRSLRVWVSNPQLESARSQSLRVLHTIKGSARLAGALRLGELAHRLESQIADAKAERATPSYIDSAIHVFDQLRGIFDALGPINIGAKPDEIPAISPVAAPNRPDVQQGATGEAVSHRLLGHSIRVRSKILDRLLDQTGEVMMGRSRLDANVAQTHNGLTDLGNTLKRMRHQLRELELQADLQMQTRQTQTQTRGSAQFFDPLEFDRFTRVQELSRLLAESVEDVATVQRNLQICVQGAQDDVGAQGRRVKELQHDLLRMRLVEFESIADRLYAVVRQACKATGKQVRLDISAGTIQLDRGVLDRITPALEHILRNAVGHGIEPVDVRLAAGKSATGCITIVVVQDGGDVAVTISDDGRGLDIDLIRVSAQAKNLWDGEADFGVQDAVRVLFLPGFTTAQRVTEMEGRGIGMDVVLSDVNALGGRIDTKTTVGVGTSFELILPLTTAVTQVVLLRMGAFTMGVPSKLMETVLRVPSDMLDRAYEDGFLVEGGQAVTLYWGGSLLQVSDRSLERSNKQNSVAIFRSAGRRVALHIDEVLGNREVVVKNLGPQLSRLPGMAGMTAMATGAVVFIYNPVALATVYADPDRQVLASGKLRVPSAVLGGGTSAGALTGGIQRHAGLVTEMDQLAPLVLVVDDSITVRRVAHRLLRREGFRVAMANDGLQALEQLQLERPMVVLTDIEMPRMDGFELTRSIRADAGLAGLPIVMITSRIAQKHRDHAASLGVNHYMGKPYSELDLMALVRSYCSQTVPV